MSGLCRFLALSLALWLVQPAGAATRFLSGSEDVPLMEGLAEQVETRIVFDTPGGRIVDVEAAGEVTADQARRYYEASLPALGWRRDAESAEGTMFWRRGAEVLVITIRQGHGAGTIVRFNLRPVSL